MNPSISPNRIESMSTKTTIAPRTSETQRRVTALCTCTGLSKIAERSSVSVNGGPARRLMMARRWRPGRPTSSQAAGPSQSTTLWRCDVVWCRSVQKFAEPPAESKLSILPPDLHARSVKEPQDVVSVSHPEVIINHARLILEENILETSKQTDSEVTKLNELILLQLVRLHHPCTEDPGEFLVAPNYPGHFREGRSRQMVSLGMRGVRVLPNLNREVYNGKGYRDCS